MTGQPGTHELGLFKASDGRGQPRDRHGRFVRVRYSAQRLAVFAMARKIGEELGRPALPALSPSDGGGA